jgi:hypothetical protein
LPNCTVKLAPENKESILLLTTSTSATSAANTTLATIAATMAIMSALMATACECKNKERMKMMVERPAATRWSERRSNKPVSATVASSVESPTSLRNVVGIL